jgi:hypothetical protein
MLPIHLPDNTFDIILLLTTAFRVLRLRMEERPPDTERSANILNRQLRTADKGYPPASGLWEVLTTPRHKKLIVSRHIQRSLGIELILRCKLSNGKEGLIFGTWNVRSLYRSRSLNDIGQGISAV